MKIDDKLRKELINKMLAPFNVTIENLEKQGNLIPSGIIKKKPITAYWWDVYYWSSEEQYLEWRNWALERIKNTKYTKYDLDALEMIYDVKHSYIFKKEGELF